MANAVKTFLSWFIFTFSLSVLSVAYRIWQQWMINTNIDLNRELAKGDLLFVCGLSLGSVLGIILIAKRDWFFKIIFGGLCIIIIGASSFFWAFFCNNIPYNTQSALLSTQWIVIGSLVTGTFGSLGAGWE